MQQGDPRTGRTPTHGPVCPSLPVLTTCTHSMSGSRTDWFPERLTTQAGVSGVASSSAITASIPILLLCPGKGTPAVTWATCCPLTLGTPAPAGYNTPLGLGTTWLLPRMIYSQRVAGFLSNP